MARQPRFDLPGVPQHVVHRGNNRARIFGCDADRERFMDMLGIVSPTCDVSVHAYVLMSNHVHLLLTPSCEGAVGKMMQSLGRRYVQYFNRRYDRSGTLWEGRYRATVIDSERYLLACYRYIELNPVRAGLVRSAAQFPWSSHACNAGGEADPLVTPHAAYCELGASGPERCMAYRKLFVDELDDATIDALRAATNKGWVFGTERFVDVIDGRVERPARPRERGGDRRSRNFREKPAFNRV